MKTKRVLFLLTMFGVAGLATQAFGVGMLGSYVALKGGVYSPSSSFNIGNVDLETTFEGDTKTGVNGEVAIGHYFLPTLALELGAGYFKGTGSFAAADGIAARRQVDFNVDPDHRVRQGSHSRRAGQSIRRVGDRRLLHQVQRE